MDRKLFEAELEKLIQDEITRLKDQVALGNCEDFANYKLRAGEIKGLQAALNFIDDANSAVAKKLNQ